MNHSYRILICLILSINLYSQKGFFKYDQIKIGESWRIERQFDAKEFLRTNKIVAVLQSDIEYEQPKIFNRPKIDDFQPVRVEYFYSKSDSLVKFINYNWNVETKYKKTVFFKTYNAQFDKITSFISKEFGEPKANQTEIRKMSGGIFDGCYERKVEWENDKCKVTNNLIWSKDKIFISFHINVHWK